MTAKINSSSQCGLRSLIGAVQGAQDIRAQEHVPHMTVVTDDLVH